MRRHHGGRRAGSGEHGLPSCAGRPEPAALLGRDHLWGSRGRCGAARSTPPRRSAASALGPRQSWTLVDGRGTYRADAPISVIETRLGSGAALPTASSRGNAAVNSRRSLRCWRGLPPTLLSLPRPGPRPPARSASRPGRNGDASRDVACSAHCRGFVDPMAGSAPEGAGGVAIDLGQQVVQARRGVQVWVGEPAAVAVGPVQRPAAVVIAKLCDLPPAPFGSEVVAPGRPPLDDRDGRAADDGLQPDLVAGVRRHAALVVAADAGDVGLGRAGGAGHGGMLSPSARASVQRQGGTLGRAAGLAPWWPQPTRCMSLLTAHGIGAGSGLRSARVVAAWWSSVPAWRLKARAAARSVYATIPRPDHRRRRVDRVDAPRAAPSVTE